MVESTAVTDLRVQIEYYLSDANLGRDKFFREQIQTDKEGWVAINHFLNCNKVKQLGVSAAEIADAVGPSEKLDVSADKLSVRRAGNLALPERSTINKRDTKAADKAGVVEKKPTGEDEYGADGKVILEEKDFDNPLIVHFEVEGLEKDEEFKVDWKEVEKNVKEHFPKLKLIYSRADPHAGDLALSNLRIKNELVTELTAKSLKIQGKDFAFSITEGEALKEFWQKQGGHYQFCIQNRLRMAKKASKMRQIEKKESVKRAKTSYEIAGVYYLDINKVKSKSRAILNLKKDGERLDGNDVEFMTELISFHEKKEAKMKDFEAFEVGVHPTYEKTRCFFVVKKDGSKEDFSVTKCIQALEGSS